MTDFMRQPLDSAAASAPPWLQDFLRAGRRRWEACSLPTRKTEQWKYTEYVEENPPFEELFHLTTDRDETQNLIRDAQYAKQLAALRARRKEWMAALDRWTPSCTWRDLEPAPPRIA